MNLLDAPIPGQGLTLPPKGSAMQHPPRFTNPEDALDFVWERIRQKKHLVQFNLLLSNGVTCETLARTICLGGVFDGMWTVDIALLIAPTVMYQIAAIGQVTKVKGLKVKNPDYQQQDFLKRFIPLMDKESPAPKEEKAMVSIFKGLEA